MIDINTRLISTHIKYMLRATHIKYMLRAALRGSGIGAHDFFFPELRGGNFPQGGKRMPML
ncbi:hypothetical protein ACJX0J_023011, partial [Zea mays]